MKTTARILTGVLALAMLASGTIGLLNPNAMLNALALSADNVSGLSHLRALLGGAQFVFGSLLAYAAIKARRDVLLIPGAYFAMVFVGRMISFLCDGHHPKSVSATAFISLLIAIWAVAYTLLKKSEQA